MRITDSCRTCRIGVSRSKRATLRSARRLPDHGQRGLDVLRERSGPEVPLLGAGVPTRLGNRFFTELKVGLGDWASDFKMLVGWNFRR